MLDKVEAQSTEALMAEIGTRARAAGRVLANAPTEAKNNALMAMAKAVRAATPEILEGNAKDVEAMKANGQTAAFLDRGTLNEERVEAIAKALEDIVALDDPVGSVIAAWERPNGLKIERVRTPLGVIGVIYESRPNVTADAGALCLKAGNAVVLRGGSDTVNSNKAIHAAMQKGLIEAGLPEDAIQIVPVTDRAAVGEMLRGLNGNLDVIVPRGGRSLVERVQTEARVPVFAHLEGLVHIFVDKAADLEKAVAIVKNSKLRRTGICGALETLLVHKDAAESHLPVILDALNAGDCEIRGDAEVRKIGSGVLEASEEDWSTEYLDKILSAMIVPDLDAAIAHIAHYGSNHTDCIITEDQAAADRFQAEVDSAIVLHNASTQFADGGEFGLGAEIGIATGRLHARGPVALEGLTTYKWVGRGTGQIRG